MIDTHVHLDDKKLKDKANEVIEGFTADGIEFVINNSSNYRSMLEGIRLAERYEKVYATVGCHPHDSRFFDDTFAAKMIGLSRHKKVVAVGEIGLDYFHNFSPPETQRQVFIRQLRLAKAVGLPVTVHVRDAYGDALKILRDEGFGVYSSDRTDEAEACLVGKEGNGYDRQNGAGSRNDICTNALRGIQNAPDSLIGNAAKYRSATLLHEFPENCFRGGVMHCFSGSAEIAMELVKMGFYIAFGGAITFKNAKKEEVIAAVPPDRVLAETDCPYMTPEPLRGQINEPKNVGYVIARLAEVYGLRKDVMNKILRENTLRLFSKIK